MNNEVRLTGIIPSTEGDISFFCNGFTFSFVPNRVLKAGETFTLPIQDGFLHGTTHNDNNVALYVGSGLEKIELQCALEASVPMYIVADWPKSKDNIECFSGITFQGGILNSLTRERAANIHRENRNVVIEQKIDHQQYTFQTNDGKCDVSVFLLTNEAWSAATDKTSFNRNVQLCLSFEKPQPITSLRKHYHNIRLLIAVMTNRMDNHFDNIYITPIERDGSAFRALTHVNIFDNDVPVEERLTDYILFEDLGGSIAKLLEILYTSKENKHSYSLGFIAKNEEERWYITEDTIRSICSALECEEAFYKHEMESAQTDPLEELCQQVKDTIQYFKDSDQNANLISEGTYAVINGSVNYWSKSAYEKAQWMLNRFKRPIQLYIGEHRPMLTETDVHEFIKFRNSISHGTYREIDSTILRTAEILEVLVYCSLFHRIGVPDEKIEEICEHRF